MRIAQLFAKRSSFHVHLMRNLYSKACILSIQKGIGHSENGFFSRFLENEHFATDWSVYYEIDTYIALNTL